MSARNKPCPNMNHGRFNPPVRYCPTCSKVVNARITNPICSEEEHARKRRERYNFCGDCGKKLVQ